MEAFTSWLTSGDGIYLVVLGAVFVGALGLTLGLSYLLAGRPSKVSERLQRTVGESSGLLELRRIGQLGAADDSGRRTLLQQAMRSIGRMARPTEEKELGRLRATLSNAGFRSDRAMAAYLATKVLLCLGCGALMIWIQSQRTVPLRFAAMYTLAAMAVGFYLPNLWLRLRVKERQTRINNALPDTLDLIVTCVEAGLGLDIALNRVAEETRLSSPLLAQELTQSSLEMRAGVARGEAFRRLAARTGVEELRNLAAMIIQTELFGTSIARSLRVQADAIRVRRMQRAEERAATVAVKLTVPLIVCIIPSLFAVLMGPAVVKIIRVLLPTLGGE